jgi:hypothetical protein
MKHAHSWLLEDSDDKMAWKMKVVSGRRNTPSGRMTTHTQPRMQIGRHPLDLTTSRKFMTQQSRMHTNSGWFDEQTASAHFAHLNQP